MIDKIVVHTPDVMGDSPRLRGRRISVYNLVYQLYSEMSIKEYGEDYELNVFDIISALNYCRYKICIVDNPQNFCYGCSLYKYKSNETFEEFIKRLGYINYVDNEGMLEDGVVNALGSIEDLQEQWYGEDGWSMAATILEKQIETRLPPF
jgi:uncharacterized protein (DUF433 family)